MYGIHQKRAAQSKKLWGISGKNQRKKNLESKNLTIYKKTAASHNKIVPGMTDLPCRTKAKCEGEKEK